MKIQKLICNEQADIFDWRVTYEVIVNYFLLILIKKNPKKKLQQESLPAKRRTCKMKLEELGFIS
jgi:hypothetical protein